MNEQQIKQILPRASRETIRLNVDGVSPSTELERDPRNESLESVKIEKSDTRRCVIRVTSYRVRLLDEDNLVPKWHIDSLRYAGCLHSDAPDQTEIITTQKKVQKKNQEKTLIQITYP